MTWQELIDELLSQNPAALQEEVSVLLDGVRARVVLAQDQDAAKDTMILREAP